jgi:hypothetical protein
VELPPAAELSAPQTETLMNALADYETQQFTVASSPPSPFDAVTSQLSDMQSTVHSLSSRLVSRTTSAATGQQRIDMSSDFARRHPIAPPPTADIRQELLFTDVEEEHVIVSPRELGTEAKRAEENDGMKLRGSVEKSVLSAHVMWAYRFGADKLLAMSSPSSSEPHPATAVEAAAPQMMTPLPTTSDGGQAPPSAIPLPGIIDVASHSTVLASPSQSRKPEVHVNRHGSIDIRGGVMKFIHT